MTDSALWALVARALTPAALLVAVCVALVFAYTQPTKEDA